MRKHYDAMVIGTALSGLISGALLARRGLEVLVINQEQIPWQFEYGGFPIQRESISGQGFKRYLFESIFEELGIRKHERSLFERSKPTFQVILKKHRIDITGKRSHLMQEYAREFPQHLSNIKKFYKILDDYWQRCQPKLSHHSLKEPFRKIKKLLPLAQDSNRKSLNDLFKELNLPPAFRTTIIAQISFLSRSHAPNPTLGLASQVLCGFDRKDYFFTGDPHGLAQIFFDRITEAGGEVRDDAFVEHLYIKRGQISGAHLNTYEGVVEASTYIGNMEIHRLFDLIDNKQKPRAIRNQLKSLKPSFARVALFLGLEASALPIGMEQHVVLVKDETQPLIADNFIFIETLSGINDDLPKKTDKKLLHVSFLVPYPEWQPEADPSISPQIEKITAQVLTHLSWFIPFLKENLLMILPSFMQSQQNPLPFVRSLEKLPLLRGIYDWAGSNYGSSLLNKTPGFDIQTRLPNLFCTGPEIFPALGFEGETLSSIFTANLAFDQFSRANASA